MAYTFVAVLALVSMASAGVIQVPAPQVYHAAPVQATTVVKAPVAYAHGPVELSHTQHVYAKQDEEFDPHPQYKFGYEVQDAVSGDSKSQVEERDGDVVHGEYSLVDADGFKRTVQYTADSVNGFNAVVNRVPLEHVKTLVKSVPATYAAPVTYIKDYSAPVAVHQHH